MTRVGKRRPGSTPGLSLSDNACASRTETLFTRRRTPRPPAGAPPRGGPRSGRRRISAQPQHVPSLDMAITQRPLAVRRDLIRVFGEDRLVAVIRTGNPQIARQAAHAMSEAGVRLVEITLTVPDAFEIIEELALDETFASRGSIVGAGTVLSGAQAEQALSAGARFLVSAVLVPKMIDAARSRDAMSMPGTMTPTEMIKAAEPGADLIKVFPVSAIGGPDFIANVRRALIHLPLVATGNVEYDEIPAYFQAGVVGFGIGGPLIRPDLLDRHDVDGVVANAKRFLAATRRGT